MPRAIDLFCGAGGMSLGLQRAGFTIVAAIDNWDLAVQTYSKNFAHPVTVADLGDISGETIRQEFGLDESEQLDLVAGGPPCQGFSIQRIGPDLDQRNNLVLDFARLVTELAPRYFVMENVRGLLGRRGRRLLGEFIARLETDEYAVEVTTLDASDVGVPQRRQRVVAYGWRRGEVSLALAPRARSGPQVTVWEAIGDLPSPPLEAVGATDPLHVQSRMSKLNRERLALIPPGGGFEDLPEALRVDCHRAGADKIGHRNVYGRLAPDEPAATITARFDSFTRGKFAHPYEDRNITLREGARLQTFPDEFSFVGNREQIAALIGNAVPPLLATVLGDELISQLGEPSRSATAASPRLF